MSRKLRVQTVVLCVCLGLYGLSGCQQQPAPPPPSSDAVTTEPLDIEVPAAPAAAPTEPAAEPAAPPAEPAAQQ